MPDDLIVKRWGTVHPHVPDKVLRQRYDECLRLVRRTCATKASPLEGLHIETVTGIAVNLAERLNANVEIVRWAALLHDIGSIEYNDRSPRHPVTGAAYAGDLMKKFGFSRPFIRAVCYCIENHGPDSFPRSLEGKIVRAADSMESVENFFELIFAFCAFRTTANGNDPAKGWLEGYKWVCDKLSAFERKLSPVPQAMKASRPQYEACLLLLDEVEPYLRQEQEMTTSSEIFIRSFLKQIFLLCWQEANRGRKFDGSTGLRQGFLRAEKLLAKHWAALPNDKQRDLEIIYSKIQMVLSSMRTNLAAYACDR